MISDHTIQAISVELEAARSKFPEHPADLVHCAAIVGEEAGELLQAALQFEYGQGPPAAMLNEAIQVAVTAIRFIEDSSATAYLQK